MPHQAGGSDGPEDRRSHAPGPHVQNVGPGDRGLCDPLLRQPVLLVQEAAPDRHCDLGADCRRPARSPHGPDPPDPGLLRGHPVGVHAEPRAFQCEGARADHDLRERRCRHSLRYSYTQRSEALL